MRIDGIFENGPTGHMGCSPGEITRITRLELLKEAPSPAEMGPSPEDDPHEIAKLLDEVTIQPFDSDGMPLTAFTDKLNAQVATELADRGHPRDWLRVALQGGANPKARVEISIDQPMSMAAILRVFGSRGPGNPKYEDDISNTFSFELPAAIRLRISRSRYRDEGEAVVSSTRAFRGEPVRVKVAHFSGEPIGPESFRVSWTVRAERCHPRRGIDRSRTRRAAQRAGGGRVDQCRNDPRR